MTRETIESESGRSMVEMLGTLAIIGVLTIGGIAGYTYAMNRHRANEILDGASKRAIVVTTQMTLGAPINLDEFRADNDVAGGTFTGDVEQFADAGQFGLKINGVKKPVCENLVKSAGEKNALQSVAKEGQGENAEVADIGTDGCEEENNLVLVFNNTASSNNGGGAGGNQGGNEGGNEDGGNTPDKHETAAECDGGTYTEAYCECFTTVSEYPGSSPSMARDVCGWEKSQYDSCITAGRSKTRCECEEKHGPEICDCLDSGKSQTCCDCLDPTGPSDSAAEREANCIAQGKCS